jgi:phage terminase small subunit
VVVMARARDPNRDKAFEIYKKYKGNIDLVEIANQLKISSGTVRGWKSKDKWTEKMNGTFQTNTERSIQKKNKKKKVVVEEVDKVMKNDELTDKQRLFCIYYVKCFNATKAYQKAYGCSYETANVEGYKTLVKPSIKTEIHNLKQTRLNREFLSEEDIFQMYIDIAFADITDYVSFGRETVEVMGAFGPVQVKNEKTGKKEILKREINTVRFKESDSVDGRLISEIKQGKDGASIKLADRMKALQWLSDHMDLATEEQKARIGVLKAKAKVDDQVSVEDKVAKLFEAIGGELDAEPE